MLDSLALMAIKLLLMLPAAARLSLMLGSVADANTPKALADYVDSILHPFSFLPFFFLNAVANELSHAPSRILSHNEVHQKTIRDSHIQCLQLIGHVSHDHNVLPDSTLPIIL